MFERLIAEVRRGAMVIGEQPTPESVARGARIMHPTVSALRLNSVDLQWGRHLIHHAEDDLFNIQLDVFSRGYTGDVHAHGTWGAFWLLRGHLNVWDYDTRGDEVVLTRASMVGPGGFSTFCPPYSDWHRVGTPTRGEQTVSIHIYGRGFDLDTGVALDDNDKPRPYARGAWGDMDAIRPNLTEGAH